MYMSYYSEVRTLEFFLQSPSVCARPSDTCIAALEHRVVFVTDHIQEVQGTPLMFAGGIRRGKHVKAMGQHKPVSAKNGDELPDEGGLQRVCDVTLRDECQRCSRHKTRSCL